MVFKRNSNGDWIGVGVSTSGWSELESANWANWSFSVLFILWTMVVIPGFSVRDFVLALAPSELFYGYWGFGLISFNTVGEWPPWFSHAYFFFLGFFWAFYHVSLVPTPELGGVWPPTGVSALDHFEVPLLNTAVLLASGVTYMGPSQFDGWESDGGISSLAHSFIGIYFTFFQALEYYEVPFMIADGVYGSTCFVAIGFHGLHVIIGSIFSCLSISALFTLSGSVH